MIQTRQRSKAIVVLSLAAPLLAHPPHVARADVQSVILVPSLCHRVVSVSRDRVDLASPKTPCGGGPAQALVTFPGDASPDRVDVYVDGTFWNAQTPLQPQSTLAERMQAAGEKARDELLKDPRTPTNAQAYIRTDAYRRGHETAQAMLSDAYQKRVETHENALLAQNLPEGYLTNLTAPNGPNAGLFGRDRPASAFNPARPQDATPKERYFAPDERLYVFISSSIPEATLRAYIADAAKLGDPNVVFVMRGFVDGARYIAPTIRFLQRITYEDPDCTPTTGPGDCPVRPFNLQIDPLLFRRYQIEEVPAFVYARGVAPVTEADADRSEGIEDSYRVAQATVLLGDASLPYVLRTLAKETGALSLERAARTFSSRND